ncbi:MAG: hypothetical protein ABIH76_03190, partial [Candidatus Bathyarchaeota archaeon]
SMKLIGLEPRTQNIAVVLLKTGAGETEALKMIQKMCGGKIRKDLLETCSHRKLNRLMKIFEISDEEIDVGRTGRSENEVLTDLIIERMALLVASR